MAGILCVFAHPDDEAFGPAGTIARYRTQGVPVHLLTFTKGQRGTRPRPVRSMRALGLLREQELRAAACVLDIQTVRVLDYMDGELDRAPPDELRAHVLGLLREAGADTVITFGPRGITGHADHIAAHRAARDAVRMIGAGVRLFYVAVEGETAREFRLEGPEAQPTHRIDIAAFLDRKLRALACHSSQADARAFFLRLAEHGQQYEHFHQAWPTWDGADIKPDLFG